MATGDLESRLLSRLLASWSPFFRTSCGFSRVSNFNEVRQKLPTDSGEINEIIPGRTLNCLKLLEARYALDGQDAYQDDSYRWKIIYTL